MRSRLSREGASTCHFSCSNRSFRGYLSKNRLPSLHFSLILWYTMKIPSLYIPYVIFSQKTPHTGRNETKQPFLGHRSESRALGRYFCYGGTDCRLCLHRQRPPQSRNGEQARHRGIDQDL